MVGNGNSESFNPIVLKRKPEVLAQQLTLIEYELYQRLTPEDFLVKE